MRSKPSGLTPLFFATRRACCAGRPALLTAALAAASIAATPATAQDAAATAPASAASAGNLFHDPFLQLSSAIKGCSVPRGPWVTAEDVRSDAHWRSQTGVSCYIAGKCRLMNSYMYDAGIGERVQQTFERDSRFANTSVWAQVQRRIVTLQGCVASADQVDLLRSAMQGIDDVNAVITELSIGASDHPPYAAMQP